MKVNNQTSDYIYGLLEEYPNLHFIAFTDTQALAVSPKSKKAHFFYYVNDDISFHFNMLCEVRSIDQPWFTFILTSLNYELQPKETETDYFEIISNWTPNNQFSNYTNK